MTKEELKITDYLSGQGYAFVSYSSKDEEVVFDKYIVPLQEQYGLRIFCDKDFKNHAYENWSDQMTENIKDAAICLVFTSEDYVCSYACMLEVLTAISNKIPILKIQLSSPVPSKDSSRKTISPATVKHFKKIGTILSRAKDNRSDYYEYYLEIEEYIDAHEIMIKRLSQPFSTCLGVIGNTIINIKDGLPAIKSSIDGACDNADIYDEVTTVVKKADEPKTIKQEEIEEDKATVKVVKKHAAVNVKSTGDMPIPEITSWPEKIDENTTLEKIASLCENRDFTLYLRNVRSSGKELGFSKQFFDYAMSTLLRGCDEIAEDCDARWNYSTFTVASKVDMTNPVKGASQFTWQSNSRKAVGIEGSGKLGEYSDAFAKLSPDTTIGQIISNFENRTAPEYDTRDNEKVINAIRSILN